MKKNKIYLGYDRITIFDVDYHDMETIEKGAASVGCTVQVVNDDGIYYTVEVDGAENKLYNFMHIVFCGLCGIV